MWTLTRGTCSVTEAIYRGPFGDNRLYKGFRDCLKQGLSVISYNQFLKMVKRRSYRKRRSYKKKRFYSKRRNFKKGSKYDGGYSAKIHYAATVPWSTNVLFDTYQAPICIQWGGATTIASTPTVRVQQLSEFTKLATIWKEYRIVGIKIEARACVETTRTDASGQFSFQSFSDPNNAIGGAVTAVGRLNYPDYKETSSRYLKRYYNVGKYYWKKGEKWKPIADYYPDASTVVTMLGKGFQNGDNMFRVHVTYYVKFKSASFI